MLAVMTRTQRNKVIFVTGTDTGVGKTLLTAMLVRHFRSRGVNALAIKPFCSGSYEDVDFLRAAQDNALKRAEIAPFYFEKPVAPLAAVKKGQARDLPRLANVLAAIESVKARCDVLLIEGAGGLMVPLAPRLFIVDVIRELQSEVILVARNKLGTINHTLLSMEMLKAIGVGQKTKIVLMDQAVPDLSSQTNEGILRGFVKPTPIFRIKFLGKKPNKTVVFEENCKKIQKTLARVS